MKKMVRQMAFTALAVGCLMLCGCPGPTEQNLGTHAELVAQQRKAESDRVSRVTGAQCEIKLTQIWDEYEKHMLSHNYQAAANAVRECATELKKDELISMLSSAEIKSYLQEFNDPKSDAGKILQAFFALKEQYPREAEKIESSFQPKIDAAIARTKSAEQQESKHSGVYIGMSTIEVLASKWGKPQSVNRTTSSSGTREQWVYGGKNYLYFENGMLTTIQN